MGFLTTAVEILKEMKARMLDGSLQKFSMDNCCFDPIKRNIEFDQNSPSGYYKLDLAEAKDREICKKLLSECKHRKQDIFRNEKIDQKRVCLTKALICGGYDGNWKGWEVSCGREAKCRCQSFVTICQAITNCLFLCLGPQPPPNGILEVDIAVQNQPDSQVCTIHNNDFQILTRAMESTGNDGAKISLLKQALAGCFFRIETR